jgi:hypothetical protein
MESQLPYVRVTSVTEVIEKALKVGTLRLEDYDLVVLATGNPTVELEVNERLHAIPGGPMGLFVWVEPLGIGGHALLTGNAPGGGCFECLYTAPDEPEQALVNRAAFAAPGQSFGRALSGCGSLHTPYGSVDAERTTALAVGLAIGALTKKEKGNPLRSWKGDPAAFTRAGFRLSLRHNLSQEQLDDQRYDYIASGCRVCGVAADSP